MLVFIIGPAAAGKTSVATRLCEIVSSLTPRSDLEALVELFDLESREGPTAEEGSSIYWPEPMQSASPRTRGLEDGHEIVDPTVWDDCLRRVAGSARQEPDLILEFARGEDRSYQDLHGLGSDDLYNPSFSLLYDEFGDRMAREGMIVLVTAPLLERLRRNRRRQAEGSHFVASSVMKTVYDRDSFSYDRHTGKYHIEGLGVSLPVFELDNSISLDSEIERLVAWLSRKEK